MGRDAIIEEKFQAAIFLSKRTACLTELALTSYHLATFSYIFSVLKANANMEVGTPSMFTIGCPKDRSGSITI